MNSLRALAFPSDVAIHLQRHHAGGIYAWVVVAGKRMPKPRGRIRRTFIAINSYAKKTDKGETSAR